MRARLTCVFVLLAGLSTSFGQSGSSKAGEALIAFVKSIQIKNVKVSTAPDAAHCFTDLDLDKFRKDRRAETVAAAAMASAEGREVVTLLRNLSSADRASLLEQARKISRPTWAQVGRITPDGSGQTDAGQQAEQQIAEQIVNLISEQVRK